MPIQTDASVRELPGLWTLVRGQPSGYSSPRTHLGVPYGQIAEVLVRARSEIADPKRWIQSYAGVTSDGVRVADCEELLIYGERQIVGMCSDGALAWAAFWLVPPAARPGWKEVYRAAEDVFHVAAGAEIVGWNDQGGRRHSEVMAMFSRAIHMAVMAARR